MGVFPILVGIRMSTLLWSELTDLTTLANLASQLAKPENLCIYCKNRNHRKNKTDDFIKKRCNWPIGISLFYSFIRTYRAFFHATGQIGHPSPSSICYNIDTIEKHPLAQNLLGNGRYEDDI
jgi:hypothetical protein